MISLYEVLTVVLVAISAVSHKAGGHVEPPWSQQGTFHRKNIESSSQAKGQVPTLSHKYSSDNWSTSRHSKYYGRQPIVEVAANSSTTLSERKIQTTGVFKTFGRGEMVVPFKGAMFHVPRTSGSRKAHRAAVSARVLEPQTENMESMRSRYRRDCSSCPRDEIVVASRGNPYVIYSHPCPHRWNSLSGPKPGHKLTEGTHYVSGTYGHKRQVCIYKFQVVVHRCPPLNKSLQGSCSADNAWGSRCNFTCPPRKKMIGEAIADCDDNLKWTVPEPICLDNHDCHIPNMENGTKLNCKTKASANSNDSFLPQGSLCKLKSNGKEIAIRCKKGDWVVVRHGKGKGRGKQWKRNTTVCEPNPCLNGGACFLSAVNTPPYLCVCKKSTEGQRCEYTRCDNNPCDNGGQCLQVGNQKTCFCAPNYTGDLCQLRIPYP